MMLVVSCWWFQVADGVSLVAFMTKNSKASKTGLVFSQMATFATSNNTEITETEHRSRLGTC